MNERTEFGLGLEEALREGLGWKRGEKVLETVEYDPMPADRIRAIRKKAARSVAQFERRFGIPAATMNNWEQGRRKPDHTARLLLQVIEIAPEVVAQAATGEPGRRRRTVPAPKAALSEG